MPSLDRRVSLVRRGFQRIADSDAVRSFAIPFMHRVDGRLLDATGGRTSATGMLLGLPIVALTTTGARSGEQRRSILTGIPHDESTIVIASNFGQDKHPAWYFNVRANPRVSLEVAGEPVGPHHASVLSGREWDEAWDLTTWHYRGYHTYRERTDRPIPLVRLVPSV